MSYNTGNKTIIDWFEALSQYEDTEHLERAYQPSKRIYRITEAVNGRVVILMRSHKMDRDDKYYPQVPKSLSSKYGIEIIGAQIVAPKWAQVTIIWWERMSIDCPENDVRFYKSWDVVTRHNPWKVHAKDCRDITAHQNNLVMVNGNERVYAKWNEWVLAIWNDELFAFHNDRVLEKESWTINKWHGGSDLGIWNNREWAINEWPSI